MPAIVSRRGTLVERKRRTHVKSRKGCENCKLRRVKCDETRPRCAKCKSYGVVCDFGGEKGSLDVRMVGVGKVDFEEVVVEPRAINNMPSNALSYARTSSNLGTPWCSVSINHTLASMIENSLLSGYSDSDVCPGPSATLRTASSSRKFSETHLEILSRFQSRTSLTVGDERMAPAYRDIVCQLAFKHPFLMHMILGLTLMHDSLLSLPYSPSQAATLQHTSLYHWDQATTLYHRILTGPIPPSHRDAIWATGVHLGAASFWYLESDDPHAVWPLKPSEPGDLSWMKIGEGKRHLWRIADPTRDDSVFRRVLVRKQGPCPMPPDWMQSNDVSLVPERVRFVFGITLVSNRACNVYHLPVLILSRIRHLRLTHGNVLDFLYFTAFSTPEFLELLEQKEPKAVFLLGWWYQMSQDGTLWWMTRRARVEGEAVRIWLGMVDSKLGKLLEELGRGREGGIEVKEGMWTQTKTRSIDESGLEVNWALDSRGRILTVA